MISEYVASEQDFMLFEPSTLSAGSEKRLIEVLLKEDFVDSPWLQRRLASYVLSETWERDGLVLDVVKFFFQGNLPVELFDVAREFDSVLAAAGKRGHFVHQFEVLILGWALIRMLINHDRDLQQAFHFETPREIFSVWLMASLVHDFGYPLQMARDVMGKLSTWYQTLGMSEVAELYNALMEEYEATRVGCLADLKLLNWAGFETNTILLEALQESLRIDRSIARRLLRNLEGKHSRKVHGYAGAIVLCGKCFEAWQAKGMTSVKVESVVALKTAMAAICLHDMPNALRKYITRMTFRDNPYAYLLFLVDNLQDWFRNLRPSAEWPSYNLLQVDRVDGGLGLLYLLTHEKWTNDMEHRVRRSIEEKSRRLKLLTSPSPSLRFEIKAVFRTSHGQSLGMIKIDL
jgi:hypothetical protein